MHVRIFDDIVETVGTIHRLCRVVARHDPDLIHRIVATLYKLAYRPA